MADGAVFKSPTGQAYYATAKEVQAASERAAMRDKLKLDFQKKFTNPMKGAAPGGNTLFDPAMQRYMSMRVSHYDSWRVTPKNAWGFLWTTVIPVVALYKYLVYNDRYKEKLYRSGEIPYSQRQWKNGL